MRFLLRRNDKTKQNKTQTLSFRGIFVIPTKEESHQVNAKQNANFVFPRYFCHSDEGGITSSKRKTKRKLCLSNEGGITTSIDNK